MLKNCTENCINLSGIIKQSQHPPPVPPKPDKIKSFANLYHEDNLINRYSSSHRPRLSLKSTSVLGILDSFIQSENVHFSPLEQINSFVDDQSSSFVKNSNESIENINDNIQFTPKSDISIKRTSVLEFFHNDIPLNHEIFKNSTQNNSDFKLSLQPIIIPKIDAHANEKPCIPESPLLLLYQNSLLNIQKSNEKTNPIDSSKYSNNPKILKNLINLSYTLPKWYMFNTTYIACYLCLIEQDLFCAINPQEFLEHNPPSKPSPNINLSTNFFNFLTNVIEYSILKPELAIERCTMIQMWIKIAKKLYEFRNFQSLKAILSALQTPPISRLKNTWSLITRKRSSQLFILSEFLSENNNYGAYRKWNKINTAKPSIPYIGIFIHDVTYITALKNISKNDLSKHLIDDLVSQFMMYKSEPRYSIKLLLNNMGNNSLYPKPKLFPIDLSAPEELQLLNNLDEDVVGAFICHFILSQKWVSEKELDFLSRQREQNVANTSPIKQFEKNIHEPSETNSKVSMATRTYNGGKIILESLKSGTKKAIGRTRATSNRKESVSNEKIESNLKPPLQSRNSKKERQGTATSDVSNSEFSD